MTAIREPEPLRVEAEPRYKNDGRYIILPVGASLPPGLTLAPKGEGVNDFLLPDGRRAYKNVFWPAAAMDTAVATVSKCSRLTPAAVRELRATTIGRMEI